MLLKGKKVIILVEEMFNVFEFWYPYYRLKEEGVEVTVVGSGSKEIYTGKPATEAKADVSADQVSADDFDGIVIPGGYAPDMMRRYPAMVDLVRDIYNADKLVLPFVMPDGCWLLQESSPDGRQPLFLR